MNKPSKCITTSGDQPNTPCIFPWKYKDEPWVYNGCANPGGYSAGHWCPTELTDGRWPAGSDKWGHCDMTFSACSNGEVEEFLSNLMHLRVDRSHMFFCFYLRHSAQDGFYGFPNIKLTFWDTRLSTLWIKRIELRKLNRGHNGLHQLGQPIAPSIRVQSSLSIGYSAAVKGIPLFGVSNFGSCAGREFRPPPRSQVLRTAVVLQILK